MTIQNQNWEMGRETRYFNGTLRKLRLRRHYIGKSLGEMESHQKNKTHTFCGIITTVWKNLL